MPAPATTPEPAPEQISTPEPTPEKISLNNKITEDNTFVFSSSDFFKNQDIEIAFTNTHSGYTIDWGIHEGTYPFFLACFTKQGDEFVSAISIEHTGFPNSRISNYFTERIGLIMEMTGINGGTRSFFDNSGHNNVFLYNKQSSEVLDEVTVISDKNKDGTYEGAYFAFKPEDNEINLQTLPRRVERDKDFLTSDETRSELRELLKDSKFAEIESIAQKYIDEEKPVESDNVFEIINHAQAAQNALRNCLIIHDNFENSYSIFYKGVEGISRNLNFIPFFNGGEARVLVGFRASDWIFFERIKIKVGDDEYITSSFNYNDINRDVIRGGGISEYINTWFNVGETEQILNAENPTIRFEGGNDKSRDHSLTNEEIEALKAIHDIHSARRSISTMIWVWEQLL